MPTIWINGVKHTPTSRTIKKMRASGQKFSLTAPGKGVTASKVTVRTASKGVGAEGVRKTSVRRAGSQTPAAAPPVPRPRGDRPKDERKSQVGGTSTKGYEPKKPLLNAGRPIGFSNTKYTGPFGDSRERKAKEAIKEVRVPPSTPQRTAMDKFQTTPAKARLAEMRRKAEETRYKKRKGKGGQTYVTGGGF